MSSSSVAAGSEQWLGSSEHIGGIRGGPGRTLTAGAAMIQAVAAEEAARLVCHKFTIVAMFAWKSQRFGAPYSS
ncbi:hypothetical protein MRX96_050221 [Rhipicephalus microplus]